MSEEEQIILPDGFRRVEYLESTGTQWLETDIKLSNKCKVILDCSFGNREFKGIYGYDQSNNRFAIYNDSKLRIDYGGNQMTSLPLTIELGKRYLIERNGNRTYVNGDLILTQTEYEFESSGTAKLFWAGYLNMYATAFKVYRFTIYKEEICVLNFIPCLDENNIPCMYELVSQKPFYNQGSGTFLTNKSYEWNYPHLNNSYNLPAGFKKCVYLQSDGTQWIDTGVVPNNETGLFCKTIKLDNSITSMFGVRDNDSSAIMTPYVGGKTISYRWKAEGKDNIYTLDKAGDYIFSSFLNFYNDRLAKINSEDTDWATSLSGILENYTQSIWLFSTNFKGSFGTYGKYAGRIYRAQITQGNTLIHDYVPCLDANGRPCMYDIIGGGTVENNTYYNQSGGTEFAYCVEHQLPSDFIKLKYLESNETQFIKTDYIPTDSTGLYIDTYNVKVSGSALPLSLRNTNGNTYFSVGRVQSDKNGAGFGWGAFTSPGGTGNCRYEATLNFLNDRKSIITAPAFAQRVNSLSTLSFTPSIDLCMFGHHSYDGTYSSGCWRIYRAKISEGSEIVRDFVPAFDVVKQRPCMYDIINNVAYYNDGKGEFLYNNDFEGTYEGFGTFATIGNKLGSYNNEDTEE